MIAAREDRGFAEVAQLAARGWKIVRLFGVNADGSCTCGKSACATPGKHPHDGIDWHHRATGDEEVLAEWVECESPVNFGVRLGPASGVIDVEFDSPEAQAVLKRFGLDQIATPAYSSGRGVHRIFRYENWMPESGVVKVDGLEVRIGGGGKATQSVIPPSRHKSGKQYEWLPGRSPDDIEPASLPDAFREAVLASSSAKGSGVVARSSATFREDGAIGEGGRHDFLLGMVTNLVITDPDLGSDAALERILRAARAMNVAKCIPPKPDAEVRRMVEDQIRFYRRERRDEARHPLERYGLDVVRIRGGVEVTPGKWRLEVVQSDPPQYVLQVFCPHSGQLTPVPLSAEEFLSPAKVAKRVMEVTHVVDLADPTLKAWSAIWGGYTLPRRDGKKRRDVRGLKSQLLEEPYRTVVAPEPEFNRHAAIAGALLDYVSRVAANEADESTQPAPSGAPRWVVREGKRELWFAYEFTWTKCAESAGDKYAPREIQGLVQRVRDAVGDEEPRTARPRINGVAKRYQRWDQRHIEALEMISGRCEASAGAA